MQVIKLNNLVKDYSPKRITTELGAPLLSINPKVSGFRYVDNESVNELFADGELLTPYFTNKGGVLAKYREEADTSSLIFSNSTYYNDLTSLGNTNTAMFISFKTLVEGAARVISVGQKTSVMFALTVTGGELTAYVPLPSGFSGTNLIKIPAYNPSGINHLVLATVGTKTFVICNGTRVDVTAYAGNSDRSVEYVTINGTHNSSSTTSTYQIYNLEIYNSNQMTELSISEYQAKKT